MEPILSVDHLIVTLKKTNQRIVDDVSFKIFPGEVVLLGGENGCGKSTVIKAIMAHEREGKEFFGSIYYDECKNLFEMSSDEIQEFRSQIAYVPQKDDYTNIGRRVRVLDILTDSANAFRGEVLSKQAISELFTKYNLRAKDDITGKMLFDEYSVPSKLSGGQQRLVSILSAVAVRRNAKLFIIDEPLNNLDFKNAKRISNLITKIHHEHPSSAILMVTHCRMFPCVTRMVTMRKGKVVENSEPYKCYSCFGQPNEQGYYD